MPAVPAPIMATSTSCIVLFIHRPWLTTMLWQVRGFPGKVGAANDDASLVGEFHGDAARSIVSDWKRAGQR
jgi:hypothetical protein